MAIHFVNSVLLVLEKIGTIEIVSTEQDVDVLAGFVLGTPLPPKPTTSESSSPSRSWSSKSSSSDGLLFQFLKSKVYYCPLCNKKQTKAIDQLPRNWTIEAAVEKLEELGPAPVEPAKQFCQIHPNMEVSLGSYQYKIYSITTYDHH